jgi:hypothetical protein
MHGMAEYLATRLSVSGYAVGGAPSPAATYSGSD